MSQNVLLKYLLLLSYFNDEQMSDALTPLQATAM